MIKHFSVVQLDYIKMFKSKSGFLIKQEEINNNNRRRESVEKVDKNRTKTTYFRNTFVEDQKKNKAIRKIIYILNNSILNLQFYTLLKISISKKALNKKIYLYEDKTPNKLNNESNKKSHYRQITPQVSVFSTSSFSISLKQLHLILNKKIALKKYYGLMKLKKRMYQMKQKQLLKIKGSNMIRNTTKKRNRRLKLEFLCSFLLMNYQGLRQQKSQLQKTFLINCKKSKIYLYKNIKTLLKRKLHSHFDTINKFSGKIQYLDQFSKFINNIFVNNLIKTKNQAFQQLKKILWKHYRMKKIIMIASPIFKILVFRKLVQSFECIRKKSHSNRSYKYKLITLKTVLNNFFNKNKKKVFEKLIHNLIEKRRDSTFPLNLSQINEKNSYRNFEDLICERSNFNEIDDPQELKQLSYKQTLQKTEKLLRKAELENNYLLQKLVENEQKLKLQKKEQKAAKQKIRKLQSELKQKQLVIKTLLLQNSKNIQYINKTRDQSLNNKNNKCNQCDYSEKKQFQYKQLTQIQNNIKNLVEYISKNQKCFPLIQENAKNYYSTEYEVCKNTIYQLAQIIQILLKDISFKKQYGILNGIKCLVKDLSEKNEKFNNKINLNFELEGYFNNNKKLYFCREYKSEQISRLTNAIIEKLKPDNDSTTNFKLLKIKINEYSKNSEIINRQLHKALQKNAALKNTLYKIQFNENQIKNYIAVFDIKKLLPKFQQQQQQIEFKDQILKVLFLDFFNDSLSFNKKLLIRQKIAERLKFSEEELQYIGIRI